MIVFKIVQASEWAQVQGAHAGSAKDRADGFLHFSTAEQLMGKIKPGGVFATVLRAPQNAARYPSVKVVPVFSKFDRRTLEFMAEAVRDGKLEIPISETLPLSEAAQAQAAAEKGGIGKILLVP